MGETNILASEKVAVIATLDPAGSIAAVQYTDVIDMSKWHQALGIFLLGNMDDAATVVCAAYRCDSAGNNAAAIKTETLGAAAGNDNTQVVVGVRKEDLLPQTTYNRYIKFGITNGASGGGTAAVVALGVDPVYGPASDNDLASVQQIENALD
jgi:hypothetical protein